MPAQLEYRNWWGMGVPGLRHGGFNDEGRTTFILPQARTFYNFRQLPQDMLSSQKSRSGHHVLRTLLWKTNSQKKYKHTNILVDYRIQESLVVG